eukprot:1645526-Prorocentrum_lima.AAC.1
MGIQRVCRAARRRGLGKRGQIPVRPLFREGETGADVSRCLQTEDEERKEDVRFAQRREDENEKIEDLQERLNELKQKLARAIKEKEKARRPLPRVLEVDKEVVEKMLSHVNPKKGHIDATPEE